MTKARTEHGDFLFKVSEYGDNTFWISTEPRHQGIPALHGTLIGFGLPKGTSLQKAYAVAEFLNENLTDIKLTIFDSHPLYSEK